MATGFSQDDFHAVSLVFLFYRARDDGCTTVKEDNQGAIHLTKTPVTTPNRKHINVRHHFLRERDAGGEFEVVDVLSALHHADFLTTPFQTEALVFTATL